MSHWRIRQRYGFGAGNVLLKAQLHRHPDRPDGLITGARRAGLEMWIDSDAPLRRVLMSAPVLFLMLVFLGMLGLNIFRVPVDQSDIQVVMLERTTPAPAIELEEPVVAEVPPPPQEPPAPAERPPEPTPTVVARTAPPPKPRPQRVEVKIAAVTSPREPIAEPVRPRARREMQPAPETRSRPRVRIDALQPDKAVPAPQPTQRRRVALPDAEAPTRSRVDLVAAAAPLPDDTPEPAARPTRRQAFAPVEATPSRARPSADLKPIPTHADSDTPRDTRNARSARPQLADTPRTRRSTSVPTTPALASAEPLPDRAPTRRTARNAQPAPREAANERSLDPRALRAPAVQPPAASAHSSAPVARNARLSQAPPSRSSTRSGTDTALRGVPLGSLAACLSDRQEDSLKQQLVAAVTTQQECVSSAGTYRFVETKNLNAFLMTIERAPGRGEADRCDELRLALACLQTGRVQ